jgi:polysaccharide export outer membrane protein
MKTWEEDKMFKYRFLLLPCFLLTCLVGRAQSPDAPGFRVTEPAPQTQAAPENGYGRDAMSTPMTGATAILGPGDLLDISVFDTPELTQRARVNGDGKITLALIGEIPVKGMTSDELRAQIRTRLIEGHFVKNPQVTVFVAEYAGQMVYVTGEVNRPGGYPLLGSHRLQDLISVAGGLTPRAGNFVTIERKSPSPTVLHVDLKDTDQALANPEMLPGDRISVELTGLVYVLGDVGRPGGFLIDRRSTLTVLKALALAEGPTQDASLTKASLLHSKDPNAQPIPLNIKMIVKAQAPDIPLEAGDIIWVNSSQTRNLGRLAVSTMLATASGVAIYTAYGH